MPDETVASHRWDPDQYSKFAAERAKPFFDLLAMVEPVPGGDVIDLGCGTGELTARLHDHTEARATTGWTRRRPCWPRPFPLPAMAFGFELGDISRFDTEAGFDVVFANASLHWVPDHPRLLRRLADGTAARRSAGRPGPGQWRPPVPCGRHAGGTREPFFEHMGADPGLGTYAVCSPEKYAELLDGDRFCRSARPPAGLRPSPRLECRRRRVDQRHDPLRFKSVLPAPTCSTCSSERYRQRLGEVLGEHSPYFYTFKRILFWARLQPGLARQARRGHDAPSPSAKTHRRPCDLAPQGGTCRREKDSGIEAMPRAGRHLRR